jgi:hypothetical protein
MSKSHSIDEILEVKTRGSGTSHSMGNRIFRLNEIVRQVVREKLKDLEEPIVRIAIDSFRKILEEEKDLLDPFDCLKEQSTIDSNIFKLEGGDFSFVNSIINHDSGPNSMTMAPLHTKVNKDGDVKFLFVGDDYVINGPNNKSSQEHNEAAAGAAASMRSDWQKDRMDRMDRMDGWIMNSNEESDPEEEEEDDEEEDDDVPVVTKEINGKQVYVFLEDDVSKTFGGHAVYRRDIKEDGESEAGDIIGFLDDHDEYWEAVHNGGKIVGFEKDTLYVPTLKGTTYPEWVKMAPKEG